MQPHYIYSPREMTRWVRGICEAIRPLENLSVEGLVRLYVHEGLRLFQDRLVHDDERIWTNENIDKIALQHFPNINKEDAIARPILYSNWMDKAVNSVSSASVLGAEALTSVVETAKQKVKKSPHVIICQIKVVY